MNKTPIFIASSPNTQKDDLKIAYKILIQPWTWRNPWKKNATAQIQKIFSKYFKTQQSFAYNTGRAAFYSILKAIGTNSNHEIITQAYTCIAVPTAIIWAEATPVYTDIDPETLNITTEQIKKKITPKTKAVIVQHTFGAPAEIDRIKELIEDENTKRQTQSQIYIIEDCAHSLGAKYKGTRIGRWGDAAFFSFGQDKIISCTQGGLATSKDTAILKRLHREHAKLKPKTFLTIARMILHPIFWALINRTYYLPDIPKLRKLSIGKGLIIILRTTGILKSQADPNKTNLTKPDIARLANAQAAMLKNQFQKLHLYNRHRRVIAQIYNKVLPKKYHIISANHVFLRFPLKLNKPQKIAAVLKKHRIIPGNWYTSPVHPATKVAVTESTATDTLEKFGYRTGSCPTAEKAAKQSLNLPTHINITENDAIRIGRIIKKRK